MALQLTIGAFGNGAAIPARFTCDGADVSPEIQWSGAPPGAKSFALIIEDPDAPSGTFTHWILYDVAPAAHALVEGYRPAGGAESGTNGFGTTDYRGPCPPRGHGTHRYEFVLFALDVRLALHAGAKRQAFDDAIRGHVLEEARYMGRYGRK